MVTYRAFRLAGHKTNTILVRNRLGNLPVGKDSTPGKQQTIFPPYHLRIYEDIPSTDISVENAELIGDDLVR